MKKIEVKWTQFSENCLDNIYKYISMETSSEVIAAKIVLSIINYSDQLKRFPNSGKTEPLLKKFGKNYRYLIYRKFKIIYWFNGSDLIIITDIFHTSQNPLKISRGIKFNE
jgi:plasmid stabilization system protein ParE